MNTKGTGNSNLAADSNEHYNSHEALDFLNRNRFPEPDRLSDSEIDKQIEETRDAWS